MKLTFPFHSRRSGQDERITQPQPPSESQPEETPSPADEQDQHRRDSIGAAHDFIHDLLDAEDRWASHMPLIRITCPHTLDSLHALGHLPQPEGVAACRKLVRVPVIHEEIGLFIWTQLASAAGDDPVSVHLNEQFRFDKPASGPARERSRDSSPASPKEGRQRSCAGSSSSSSGPRPRSKSTQLCHFCQHESIEKCDEALEKIQAETLAATRGRVASCSGKSLLPALQPDARRQRSFFFHVSSRKRSRASSLKWYVEDQTPSTSSRASSMTRKRSGSLVGKLGSAVGGLGHRVVGVLGEGLSHGNGQQPDNRGRSARSL